LGPLQNIFFQRPPHRIGIVKVNDQLNHTGLAFGCRRIRIKNAIGFDATTWFPCAAYAFGKIGNTC